MNKQNLTTIPPNIRQNPSLLYEIRRLPRLVNSNGKKINYSHVTSNQCLQIIQFLLRYPQLTYSDLGFVANMIGISHNTIISWRDKANQNSNFDPKTTYEMSHRAMTPSLEEKILNEIETNFLIPGYYFNNHILKVIATAAFENARPEEKLRTHFSASKKWCVDFRRRHGYVWRKGHYKKRPTQSEKTIEIAKKFNNEMTNLVEELTQRNQL